LEIVPTWHSVVLTSKFLWGSCHAKYRTPALEDEIMSRSDPNCFPELHRSDKNVCLMCFTDRDLKQLIVSQRKRGACDYCEDDRHRPIMNMSDMADYIKGRMLTFYGYAGDQLPYESREGGYQGWTSDTEDILFESIGLDLENDYRDKLRTDLLDDIGDETWCDFDWLCLDYDKSLLSSWSEFCDLVKTQRRYFFQNLGGGDSGHPDDRSIGHFLSELDAIIDLANMPNIPGFYSNASRRTILGLQFLYRFAEQIAKPVARDDRVHIEYIPTQILSEYFREFGVSGQDIDGISYRSATGHGGINTVLFATQKNLITTIHPDASPVRWLGLNSVEHIG